MSSSYLPDLLFVTAPLHSSCNKNPYQQNLVFSGGIWKSGQKSVSSIPQYNFVLFSY